MRCATVKCLFLFCFDLCRFLYVSRGRFRFCGVFYSLEIIYVVFIIEIVYNLL